MKTIFPILLIIVVGILGYVAFFKDGASAPQESVNSAMPAPGYEGVEEMIVEDRMRAYSVGEVSAHNSLQSCWAIIRGNVYDLTAWIGKHPGGEAAIMKTCGIDATSLFENQHGGGEQPESTLATFKIGIVAE